MVKAQEPVVVEVDGPCNEAWLFSPLQRRIRGHFDPHRLAEPGRLARDFPAGIPGEKLEVDFSTGTVTLVEPLHGPECAATRERIAARGMKLQPERQELGTVDSPTLSHWLRRGIETGIVRLVSGSVPDVDGKPRTGFLTTPQANPLDRLAAALEKQSEMIGRLLAKLG